MSQKSSRVRVLFSYPLKLEVVRICGMTGQQLNGLAAARADVLYEDRALLERLRPASLRRTVREITRTAAEAKPSTAIQLRSTLGEFSRRLAKRRGIAAFNGGCGCGF
jgi:hypothetical protein